MDPIQVEPIGVVAGGRTDPIDDDWGDVEATIVLDVKPYLREFAPRGEVREPEWVVELMRGYW